MTEGTHEDYMAMALELAGRAKGFTSPNPCVGAVVVKAGRVVGKGFHRAAGLPHAEVEAIDDAGEAARGAAIYVTLEPCNHFGRTPPCTHKIVQSGIQSVFLACKDPNPVASGGIQYLESKGIRVQSGILEDQAHELNEDFFWYVRQDKKPFVILKSAATLDGRIATSTGDSRWITSEEARAFGHGVRHAVDAILVGAGTLGADDPSLTARIPGKKACDPARVILDTRLGIRETARVLNIESDAPTIVVHGPDAPEDKMTMLRKKGARLLSVPLTDQGLDLHQVMIRLGELSMLSLLIEGGGAVAGNALRAGIVNKVMYFIAPKILGSSDGTPVFSGRGPEKIADAFRLDRTRITRLGPDILVQGYLR